MKKLLFVLAVAACSKSSDPGKPPPEQAAAPEAAAPAAAPEAPAPSGDSLPTIDKIDCAKVLPQSLLDRFFPKQKVDGDLDNTCSFYDGDQPVVLEYECKFALSADDMKPVEAADPSSKEVAGIGRIAWKSNMQMLALDNDSACVVTANFFKPPAKLDDFMRAVLDAVPAK